MIVCLDISVSYVLLLGVEMEMQKRRSEVNLRFYNARERIQEDSEKEQV